MLVRAQNSCGDWETAKLAANASASAASANLDAVRYAARAVANAADNAANPSLYSPTVDSVHQKAKARADDFLNAVGNTAAFNEVVGYYAGLVADEAKNNPENVRAAYQNVYNSREPITRDVGTALTQVKEEANSAVNLRSVSLSSIKNAAKPERSEFDAGPVGELSFDYAMRVLNSIGVRYGYQAGPKASELANQIINEVTNNLAEIPAAARREAEREFNPDTVKKVVRDNADWYKTSPYPDDADHYFAADFIAKAAERGSTIDEIRNNVNTAYNTHFKRGARGGLFRYHSEIFGAGGRFSYVRYEDRTGDRFLDSERSFFNFMPFFTRSRDKYEVVKHYHDIASSRLVPAYLAGFDGPDKTDRNSDDPFYSFFNELSAQGRTYINTAFNDPYYNGDDTPDTPLDDPNLYDRHPEANHILNEALFSVFNKLVDDFSVYGGLVALDVRNTAIDELSRKPTPDTVKAEAEKVIRRLTKETRLTTVTLTSVSELAGNFVRERIAGSDGQNMQTVVSNIEAAVDEAIPAVTYGANFAAQKVQDAYADHAPSVSSVKTAAQNRAGSYSGTRGHRAAVFVAGIADVDADDPSDVIGNIERDIESLSGAISSATQEVVNAASGEAFGSVREIDPDVAYVQAKADSVVDRLRLHPALATAELVAGAISGPGSASDAARRADDKSRELRREASENQGVIQNRFRDLSTCASQCRSSNVDHEATGDCPVSLLNCSVSGVSCSGNVDCCSGVCDAGTCADVPVCVGEGVSGCSDASDCCVSGNECMEGQCVQPVGCSNEGIVGCLADDGCCGALVCDDGTCVDATVSVPVDTIPVDTIPAYTHSFDDPINSDSPIEFPVANDDIPFTSVNFTVSDTVTGLDLTLTSQSELPSGIPNGPGVVPSSNGYVNITSNLDPDYFDNGNVSSMNVTFRVERSFVSDNGVSPDDVSLFRYDETAREWVELDTVRLSDLDDGTYHYYEAIGTGDLLGVFAVALSQYLSCAHIENSKGKNRYSIELVYSWYDSLSINHRIKGELLANAPE